MLTDHLCYNCCYAFKYYCACAGCSTTAGRVPPRAGYLGGVGGRAGRRIGANPSRLGVTDRCLATPSAVWLEQRHGVGHPFARATMNSTVLDLPALLPGQLVAWQSPVLYAAALALAALWLCSGRSSSQKGWAAIPGPAPASRLLGHVQQVSGPPGGLGGTAASSSLPLPPPAAATLLAGDFAQSS